MHQNQKFAVDVQGARAVFPYVTCVDQLLCGQSLHVKEARCVCLSYEPSLQKLWHAGIGQECNRNQTTPVVRQDWNSPSHTLFRLSRLRLQRLSRWYATISTDYCPPTA